MWHRGFLQKSVFRVDKNADISIVLSKLGQPQLGSSIQLSKDTLDTTGADDETCSKDKNSKKKADPHPILPYLKTKVSILQSFL